MTPTTFRCSQCGQVRPISGSQPGLGGLRVCPDCVTWLGWGGWMPIPLPERRELANRSLWPNRRWRVPTSPRGGRWSSRAADVIEAVIEQHPDASPDELRRHLRDARPPEFRRGWPAQAWRTSVRRTLARWPGPFPRRADPRQRVLPPFAPSTPEAVHADR